MEVLSFPFRSKSVNDERSVVSAEGVTDIIWHGPFDIQGRGGGLGFLVRAKIFFQTKWEQDYFFRRPFGPDYYYFFS